MKNKKQESRNLVEMKNFLDYNKKINKEDNTFQKLMVIYKMAIKELNTKVEIIKEEYKLFYNYDLIDHINFRIKEPDSIIKKMKNKECKLTYKEMIENINDIAGIRIVCSLKKDIFSIKNLLQKLPGVRTIKEKDYVTNPKKKWIFSLSYNIRNTCCFVATNNICKSRSTNKNNGNGFLVKFRT